MRLRVASTASSIGDSRGSVCIVVDVVRASTTLLTLCERGAGPIRFAIDLDEARRAAQTGDEWALLIGEQGGIIAPGFDLDNSPTAATTAAVTGRRVVMRTSNGTVALALLSAAPLVLVGCIRNGAAVIEQAIAEATTRKLEVLIVCAGQEHGTVFALDDTLAAGFLVACAWEKHGPWAFPDQQDAARTMDESALAALTLYHSFVGETTTPDAETFTHALLQGAGPRFIATTGRLEDVRYCATPNCSAVVPRVQQTPDGPTIAGGRPVSSPVPAGAVAPIT
ncbi:MAG: 2-phosphosulfolactate phosphatase [Chloroflexota bacterium]|nr:2-phosphosulfolactate phosphatase [Chloroflexota bacterium]